MSEKDNLQEADGKQENKAPKIEETTVEANVVETAEDNSDAKTENTESIDVKETVEATDETTETTETVEASQKP